MLWILLLLVMIYLIYELITQRLARRGLPPGPTPLPFIGNVHQMDMGRLHLTFDLWAKRYGAIVSADLMGRNMVILNSYDTAKEAMIKQGDNFAGRPKINVFDKAFGGKGYVFSEGPLWKEQRRHGLHVLREFGFGRKLQEDKIETEIRELFEEIDEQIRSNDGIFDPLLPLKVALVNVMSGILMSRRFGYQGKEIFKLQKDFSDLMEDAQKLMLIEFMPLLHLLPPKWNGLEKSRKLFQNMLDWFEDTLDDHEATLHQDLENGGPTDFVYAYLQEIEKRNLEHESEHGFTRKQLLNNLNDLFVAGFETSATTLHWFILYMVHYPDVQERMRQEIIDKVGGEPSWAARNSLPYCCAVVAEVQRCANIIPFGEFHSNFEETILNGYRIPQRSIVVINHWSIMRDNSLFEEPDQFKPERFLDESGRMKDKMDGMIPFSLGKRVCMGEGLAKIQLFLFTTSLVSNYRFQKSPNGKIPSLEGVQHFTLAPQPYEVQVEKLRCAP